MTNARRERVWRRYECDAPEQAECAPGYLEQRTGPSAGTRVLPRRARPREAGPVCRPPGATTTSSPTTTTSSAATTEAPAEAVLSWSSTTTPAAVSTVSPATASICSSTGAVTPTVVKKQAVRVGGDVCPSRGRVPHRMSRVVLVRSPCQVPLHR